MTHRRRGNTKSNAATAANCHHSDSNDSDVDSSENAAMMKGLLQCVLGVGGMAIILWAVFIFLILPYVVVPLSTTMNEQPPECTQVGSVKQLIEELREIVDWRLLGEELGVETNRLQQIDSGNTENEHKKRAMIRAWVDSSGKSCWETIIQALKTMNQLKMARNIADKYGSNGKK